MPKHELVQAAQQAQQAAYAPYSQYRVGAALRTKAGKVYLGANIENAAYPDSICAERVAIFTAIMQGEREFDAIAVVTRDGGSPCGSCRQVLAEFALHAEVILATEAGAIVHESSVDKLLPGAFLPSNLDVKP
ncbi:MAG: cytidine deaminase [Anaerolineales bacterium]|nr:cytidine deaminase [Anaerolineales bacterium]MBX3005421.1 cytidine deaminase [Anaerolineales bacterium]MCW5838806.1 cytidine deaminase [Anaerolineales bacterium]